MTNKYHSQLLTELASQLDPLYLSLDKENQDNSDSIKNFRLFLTEIVSIINNKLPHNFDPIQYIHSVLANYPPTSTEAEKFAEKITKIRKNVLTVLETNSTNSLTQNTVNFQEAQIKLLEEFLVKSKKLYSELKKFPHVSLEDSISKDSETEYSPIPNIFSHDFVRDFFSPKTFPIDQLFAAQFVSRVKGESDTEIKEMKVQSTLERTEDLHKELFKMSEEVNLQFQLNELLTEFPEPDIIMSHPYIKSMKKQMTNYLLLLNDASEKTILAQQSIDLMKTQFHDLVTAIEEFPVACEEKTCNFPCIASKINALDNEGRALHYMTNIMMRVQYFPVVTIIQPVNDYVATRKRVRILLEGILKNGFRHDCINELDNCISRIKDSVSELQKAKNDVSDASKRKESALQKMVRTSESSNRANTAIDPRLADLRQRVFGYSKKVLSNVDEKIKEKDELREAIRRCAAEFEEFDVPQTYLANFLKAGNDEKDTYLWLTQVKEQLQSIVDEKKEKISDNSNMIDKLKAELSAQTTNKGSPQFQVDDFVYDNLLKSCTCQMCGMDICYSIGKCGHCFCEECATKTMKIKPHKCPICGATINLSDFIYINWE